MVFPTVTFAIFFVVAMAASWAARRRPRVRQAILIAAGLVFYSWWDWRFAALLIAMILATHAVAEAMGRWPAAARVLLVTGVSIDLAVLFGFKYYGFFAESLADLLAVVGLGSPLPLLQVTLVVGLSFYTFEAIAYLVEIRRGVGSPVSLLDLTACLTFFPKLASGPITRVRELAPQLQRPPASIEAQRAFWLVGRGLVKKVVLASYLASTIADPVFDTPSLYSAGEVLVGIYAYTAQIYLDFSAYTDIAIGIGLLLGARLPENFDRPYAATSVGDFWRRWHMSLTRWIRDFLFQPLAYRARGRPIRSAAAILVVMLAIGVWHGAAWTFVAWGAAHGVVMVVERLARGRRRARHAARANSTARRILARFTTFHIVAFAWVLFRADSLESAGRVFGRLGAPGSIDAVDPLLLTVLVATFAAQLIPPGFSERLAVAVERVGPVIQTAGLAVTLLFIDALGPSGVAPFIYFRF